MRKHYLLTLAALSCATLINAAAPEGDLYILGLNGNSTPDESNTLTLQERTADDVDEGVWRWALPSINLTETEGSFTVSDGKSLKLGFDEANEFGLSNSITTSQALVYMTVDGPAINYSLPAGDCSVSVVMFEDIDGENGKDTWMVQIQSASAGTEDSSYYLLGFNGVQEPEAAVRFKMEIQEADGETFVSYSLPKFLVSGCPDGFTVYGSQEDSSLGLSTEFSDPGTPITDNTPMAFLAPGGEPVKCELTEGYYSVSFSSLGAVSMISFTRCEDQTPLDQMDYYLIGVNGTTTPSDAVRFQRDVIVTEFEEDGEIIRDESVVYTLKEFKYQNAPEGLTVSSADGMVIYGYSTDMAAMIPNDMTDTNPFAVMAVNGEPVKCSLSQGTYDISFMITGNGTGMISFEISGENSVGAIASDGNAREVFYNLNGIMIDKPGKGIYIVRNGSEFRKVIK